MIEIVLSVEILVHQGDVEIAIQKVNIDKFPELLGGRKIEMRTL